MKMEPMRNRACDDRVCFLLSGEDWQSWAEEDRQKILLARDGIFVMESNELFRWARPATHQDLTSLLAAYGTSGIGCGVATFQQELPKIPMELLLLALSTFRRVWEVHQREEILLLYYFYEVKRYTLVAPPLISASDRHVDYDMPETPRDAIRIGSFHSHGSRAASHSLDDQEDDAGSPGIHVIIGNLDTSLPSLHCVYSDGRGFIPMHPPDVFAQAVLPKAPEAWVDRVPKKKEIRRVGRKARKEASA